MIERLALSEINLSEAHHLLEEYGLKCTVEGNSLHTTLHASSSAFSFYARLFGNWICFELMPPSPVGSDQMNRISGPLLSINSSMRLAKFGKTADGELVLSMDLPIQSLSADRLTRALDLLRTYAEVHLSQLHLLDDSAVQPSTSEDEWFEKGWERLTWHVVESPYRLEYDHATGGKLPRNHMWRPYRFCVQDVLFGATVVRHAREHNCLEVDVFLTAEVPQYEPNSGARWLATFLLSEAFKCGGSMEVRFTEYVEQQRIPTALCRLAEKSGVPFSRNSIDRGRISPQEARELYVQLTDFSSQMRQRMDELVTQGRVSVERLCYSVHHGVWTLPELESIVLGAPFPDMVLTGEIQSEQRHLYSHAVFHARSALLGGFLDRALAHREHADEAGGAFDLEDDERNIDIEFTSDIYAKRYRCADESMVVPWLHPPSSVKVPPGESISILIRARDAVGLKRHLIEDIELAAAQPEDTAGWRGYVLVPFDFNDPVLSDSERHSLLSQAKSKGVRVMVAPESTSTLDAEVRKRFMSSRIMRQ